MRIIAFVGSPVEDNEKDVSLVFLSNFVPIPQGEFYFYQLYIIGLTHYLIVYILMYVYLSASHTASVPPADSAACQVGKALEKREGECGYYQLWRRGEDILVYLPLHCYKAV